MRQTLQELLDYAESCLTSAQGWSLIGPEVTPPAQLVYYQRQSMASSQLAIAVALASAVKYPVNEESSESKK